MHDHRPKRPSDAGAVSPEAKRARDPSAPSFTTYKDAPDLPPKIRLLCDILASGAPDVEAALDDAGVRVTTADVEQVLRFSYAHPRAAIAFFRWAGHRHLAHEHSPYSWNLVVDILGRNRNFDSMWETVDSMQRQGLLSLATFASVFSSLAAAPGSSPLKAFVFMPRYGMERDTPALNSLLSALCRAGRLDDARAAIPVARAEAGTHPDADSYAILLEGCEAAADPRVAHEVFDEMVGAIGFDPANVPAYDSFLTTLVSSDSPRALSEAIEYLALIRRRGCSPGEKFFRAALTAYLKARELCGAVELWDDFVRRQGLVPDMEMYTTMIKLQGSLGHAEVTVEYLDDMTFNGVFPDTNTYNLVLQFLLKEKQLREAAPIFNEMIKNECWPNEENCSLALSRFLDKRNWDMGMNIWKCMVDNGLPPLEDCGNMLVSRLKDDRLPEACKIAEDMIDKGIKLTSSTLRNLKLSLQKIKKGEIHDQLLRKWKAVAHYMTYSLVEALDWHCGCTSAIYQNSWFIFSMTYSLDRGILQFEYGVPELESRVVFCSRVVRRQRWSRAVAGRGQGRPPSLLCSVASEAQALSVAGVAARVVELNPSCRIQTDPNPRARAQPARLSLQRSRALLLTAEVSRCSAVPAKAQLPPELIPQSELARALPTTATDPRATASSSASLVAHPSGVRLCRRSPYSAIAAVLSIHSSPQASAAAYSCSHRPRFLGRLVWPAAPLVGSCLTKCLACTCDPSE